MLDPYGQFLIAIDGTSTEKWLTNPTNPQKTATGQWLSHVLNFHDDTKLPDSDKYYDYGPNDYLFGSDIGSKMDKAYEAACDACCKKDQPVDLIGWSRGGLAVNELARKLLRSGCCCPTKKDKKRIDVRFLGLYDGVDMTPFAGNIDNRCAKAQTVVMGYGIDKSKSFNGAGVLTSKINKHNMDWKNWKRMKMGPLGGHSDLTRLPLDASHGAIGGCPGYGYLRGSPDYDYPSDRLASIQVDQQMRARAIAVGVPVKPKNAADYGFPLTLPAFP